MKLASRGKKNSNLKEKYLRLLFKFDIEKEELNISKRREKEQMSRKNIFQIDILD